jgi:hypothetical protein
MLSIPVIDTSLDEALHTADRFEPTTDEAD